MKALRLALLEFRRFRGPLLRKLVPIGLALIPLLYGSLYLWSNWDPYGKTDQIPVAVVIEDRPVTANGQVVDAGKQFEQQLRATPKFQWHFVDRPAAEDGLVHGRFYFTITVPPDFSRKLISAEKPIPERATLGITLNDANNFIVGVVADVARSELQNQVNSAAHAAYAKAIYGDLTLVKQQLKVAATGVHALVDSSVLAQQGTAALAAGLDGSTAGTAQISDGVARLAQASNEVDTAVTQLVDTGTATLPTAAGALSNATGAAAQSLELVRGGADLVRQQADQGSADLRQLAVAHPELLLDPTFRQALDHVQAVGSTAGSVADTARQAHDAAAQASNQAGQLAGSVDIVRQNLRGAAAPLHALTAGASTVSGGAIQITNSLASLQASSRTLQTGADQLHSGATKVADTVDSALVKIPDTSPEQTAAAADVLGSPVGIVSHNLNPAGLYGRGLTPFFFAIALWVLGLLAYLFIQPLNQRAVASRVSPWTVAVAGWLPVAGIAVAGGLILYGVVQVGLRLDPVRPIQTAGLMILAAAAFVAIDHFLRVAFGVVGEALSLVLLILQLTSCGGLYPIETTPAPFRIIHPFLPMTYLVDGLRVTISGGLTGNLLRDCVILLAFLLGSLACTALVVRRQRVWTINRLHPAVEV
ncbi:YhgE/Pip domain-containing protein [Nocardia suismassiliense]|uniref:YhgE/Pip domain-containing protein n=1 Tax=Nocardia suismassiliense TaxID=2077092 RepID=UPI000D1F44A6|nr:YhgE/Pip domain-containing protein [Nocardia suismassiliense]